MSICTVRNARRRNHHRPLRFTLRHVHVQGVPGQPGDRAGRVGEDMNDDQHISTSTHQYLLTTIKIIPILELQFGRT